MQSIIPRKNKDWTDRERAEIERIQRDCTEFSNLQFECSHSDENDPWCIVYDTAADRILLHIARIDRRYVVVPQQKGLERYTSMVAAVETALKWLLEQKANVLAEAG